MTAGDSVPDGDLRHAWRLDRDWTWFSHSLPEVEAGAGPGSPSPPFTTAGRQARGVGGGGVLGLLPSLLFLSKYTADKNDMTTDSDFFTTLNPVNIKSYRSMVSKRLFWEN